MSKMRNLIKLEKNKNKQWCWYLVDSYTLKLRHGSNNDVNITKIIKKDEKIFGKIII